MNNTRMIIKLPAVVTINYAVIASHKGAKDSLRVPQEPDEDAQIEIESIIDENGVDRVHDLTTDDCDDIEQRIKNQLNDSFSIM